MVNGLPSTVAVVLAPAAAVDSMAVVAGSPAVDSLAVDSLAVDSPVVDSPAVDSPVVGILVAVAVKRRFRKLAACLAVVVDTTCCFT